MRVFLGLHNGIAGATWNPFSAWLLEYFKASLSLRYADIDS